MSTRRWYLKQMTMMQTPTVDLYRSTLQNLGRLDCHQKEVHSKNLGSVDHSFVDEVWPVPSESLLESSFSLCIGTE